MLKVIGTVVVLLSVLIATASCSAVRTGTADQAGQSSHHEVQSEPLTVIAVIADGPPLWFDGSGSGGSKHFHLSLQMLVLRNDRAYTHVIQEVETSEGWRLVECWPVSLSESGRDVHTGSSAWRRCRVYLGDVSGQDANSIGFAHVPANRAGTFITNIPPEVNAWHQAQHRTTGCVVRCSRDTAFYTWGLTKPAMMPWGATVRKR